MKRENKWHEKFVSQLIEKNKSYRDWKFSLSGKYINMKTKIGISDMYWEHLMSPMSLVRWCVPSIKSCIDKEWYIDVLLMENELLEYKTLKYIAESNILIEWPYWVHRVTKSNIKKWKIPCFQSAMDKFEFIKRKMSDIHNGKYIYEDFIMNTVKQIINIKCKKHWIFRQKVQDHLDGNGCPHCGQLSRVNKIRQNPTGWSLSNRIHSSKRKNKNPIYKLYFIEIYDKTEHFYKIWRTYQEISARFCWNALNWYSYKIINIITSFDAKYIYNLENDYKKNNRNYCYIPQRQFHGMYECFSKIEDIN